MTDIERLQIRLGLEADQDVDLLNELLVSSESAIMARRFPFKWTIPPDFPPQYNDLKLRIAADLYNKRGAEGQLIHSENGTQRSYESAWISESLLREVTPVVGVVRNANAGTEQTNVCL